jgi:hypothetical protein
MNEDNRSFCKLGFLLVLCAAGVCLARQSSSVPSVWWAPDLQLTSLSDVDQALTLPLTSDGKQASVTLRNDSQQKTVETCAQYLEAIDQGLYPANEQGSDTPFVNRCYALRYLKSAQQPHQSFIEANWGSDVLSRLPPFEVFAEASTAAKANEARQRHESWGQFDPTMSTLSRTANNVLFQNRHERWDLKIVALGDFNHDGVEDEVVIACNSRKTGSGGSCFPVVLTASAPGQVMTLISSPTPPYQVEF